MPLAEDILRGQKREWLGTKQWLEIPKWTPLEEDRDETPKTPPD